MKILIVARNYYPSILGGPSITLYWLACALVKHSFEVSVVTSSDNVVEPNIKFNEWQNIDGVKVFYAKVNERDTFHLSVCREVKKVIKTFDIVVLGSLFYKPAFYTALLSRLYNKKLIWSPRGELFESAIKGSKLKKSFISIEKFFFKSKTLFHATSQAEEQLIYDYFGKTSRVVVLPNYLVIPKQVDRDNSIKYLLFVGRIAPIKALHKLFVALAQSEKFRKSNFRFLVAGKVEAQFQNYKKELDSLISDLGMEDKIDFIGSVVGVDKEKLYANAYMSFLVSDSENFGNVVIEALSQGTPVVTSKGTPWQELVEHKAGYWVANDTKSLVGCIDDLLELSDVEYLCMRKNALAYAMTFDIDKNISKWIETFISI